jgi:hypothetical protein
MEVSRQSRGVLLLTPPIAQLDIVGKAPFTRTRPICLDSGGTETCEGRFAMWQEIPGHPEYQVSFDGQIWSSKTNQPLKPISARDGHQYVFLYDGRGHSIKMWIHRAVLFAFIGPPDINEECRHLDGNPTNNSLTNLAWGTHQENVNDRRKHGRMPIPHKSQFTKLEPKDIPRIRELQTLGYSSRKVARLYGTSHTTILKIWRGERWKGY